MLQNALITDVTPYSLAALVYYENGICSMKPLRHCQHYIIFKYFFMMATKAKPALSCSISNKSDGCENDLLDIPGMEV